MSDLFDFSEGRARTHDPDTSQAAARALETARSFKAIMGALESHSNGLTTWELVYVTYIPFETVSPRMVQLEEKRLVRRTDVRRIPLGRKRAQIVWMLV